MMSAGEGVVLVLLVLLVLLLLLLCFVASLPRSPSKLMLCLPIVKRSELFSAGLFAESGLFLPCPLFRLILSAAEAGTGSENLHRLHRLLSYNTSSSCMTLS
jgi:hypothetical protein